MMKKFFRSITRNGSSGEQEEAGGGLVSDSARVIAAWRALETAEPHSPLFEDPFAAGLAGKAALADAQRAAQNYGASGPPRRKHKVSNVAARVYWFDQQILEALRQQPEPRPQVVVLGSGMDTRPWRLALPPGVPWLEIDREEVLAIKQSVLHRQGADFGPEGLPPAGSGDSSPWEQPRLDRQSPPLSPSASGGQHQQQQQQQQHALMAETWTAFHADLGQPGWVESLAAHGFDRQRPTVWVAEGLLMYLSEDGALRLLRDMAGASAPGSTLIALNCSDELMAMLSEGPVDYPPFTPELVATWKFGLPLDPGEMLQAQGWRLRQVLTRAAIAQELFSGAPEGRCDFETRIGHGRDRYAVFIVAEI